MTTTRFRRLLCKRLNHTCVTTHAHSTKQRAEIIRDVEKHLTQGHITINYTHKGDNALDCFAPQSPQFDQIATLIRQHGTPVRLR